MNALLVANAEDLVSPSAFRATNPNTTIPISQADTFVKVTFPNEQFDIGNNEYNAATSTLYLSLMVYTRLMHQSSFSQIIQILIMK
ncbi:hypothetical protein C1N57_27090 (plasmid) [Priestia aryabhattai]